MSSIDDVRSTLYTLVRQVEELPPPIPPAPKQGADPSKIDWDHVLSAVTLKPGQRIENCVVDGPLRGSSVPDVKITNVHVTGGSTPPTSGTGAPIVHSGPGWEIDGLTVDPKVSSVMWSEGLRMTPYGYAQRVHVQGTVDGVAVVTPSTATRTDVQIVDLLVENLPFWSSAPNQTNGSHNDGIQFHGPIHGVKVIRPVISLGDKATAGIMANVPTVNDLTIVNGIICAPKASVNFGPTSKGSKIAVVDMILSSPVGVYTTDALLPFLRLDRSVKGDGSPATRSRS